MARVELPPIRAIRSRRSWGYFLGIQKSNSANTTNPYLLTAVVRIVYLRECESDSFFFWRRAPKYASNFLTSEGTSVMEGTPMTGVLRSTFGDYLNASIGSWRPSALSQWRPDYIGPRRSPPMWTLTICRGRPTYTRGVWYLRQKEEPPKYGNSYSISDTRIPERNAKRVGNIHESKHSSFFSPFRLDSGISGGQLPGRSEPPRKSVNAATYAGIRE